MLHSRQMHSQLKRIRQSHVNDETTYYPLALRTQCIHNRIDRGPNGWFGYTDILALSAYDAAYDAAANLVDRLSIQL